MRSLWLFAFVGAIAGCAQSHAGATQCGHHCEPCCPGDTCVAPSFCARGYCAAGALCDAGRSDAGPTCAPACGACSAELPCCSSNPCENGVCIGGVLCDAGMLDAGGVHTCDEALAAVGRHPCDSACDTHVPCDGFDRCWECPFWLECLNGTVRAEATLVPCDAGPPSDAGP